VGLDHLAHRAVEVLGLEADDVPVGVASLGLGLGLLPRLARVKHLNIGIILSTLLSANIIMIHDFDEVYSSLMIIDIKWGLFSLKMC
jgi:hypothetical protein